ncbi:hypothetical protein TTHERM_000578429 (macronuclear) [Tetrahymena thermophila SB210]|uniref:Uncharacterized protein n=1 Tax=Tetrahymena thermophila (strain SB210) TaxID=312017 RepID=W7XEV4_TETTS|nr:hypothetical protein TTHERM_000578429 [Tetrahymena thermophila SB210]EWS72506.1 hypothetical protein TTHERM_000578429 [Tetrahymena thermophila SB210]|eukprot:XP_012654942.1 hypothetical protein TTHERM_000578429 [Tetrahymena thermophila SB210]
MKKKINVKQKRKINEVKSSQINQKSIYYIYFIFNFILRVQQSKINKLLLLQIKCQIKILAHFDQLELKFDAPTAKFNCYILILKKMYLINYLVRQNKLLKKWVGVGHVSQLRVGSIIWFFYQLKFQPRGQKIQLTYPT